MLHNVWPSESSLNSGPPFLLAYLTKENFWKKKLKRNKISWKKVEGITTYILPLKILPHTMHSCPNSSWTWLLLRLPSTWKDLHKILLCFTTVFLHYSSSLLPLLCPHWLLNNFTMRRLRKSARLSLPHPNTRKPGSPSPTFSFYNP